MTSCDPVGAAEAPGVTKTLPVGRADAVCANAIGARLRRARGRRGDAVMTTLAAATLVGRGDYVTVTQPSTAMESTVHLGERVVFSKKLSPAHRDVVIVHLVRDDHAYDAMLRVVALPGDTIGCPTGPTGRCEAVVVNGTPVPEPYLGATVTDPFPISMVPDHTIFLLGDNRAVANDSRVIGPVRLADTTGVAVQIEDRDGQVRAVPGAPAHPGPGDRDNVDPAGPVPPPGVSVPR
jgi:signal peptidase I